MYASRRGILANADGGFPARIRDLRHEHASWLLAGAETCKSSRNGLVTAASRVQAAMRLSRMAL
jgi:hypothetical protein